MTFLDVTFKIIALVTPDQPSIRGIQSGLTLREQLTRENRKELEKKTNKFCTSAHSMGSQITFNSTLEAKLCEN